jgi:phosphate transport system substrate-binding protein
MKRAAALLSLRAGLLAAGLPGLAGGLFAATAAAGSPAGAAADLPAYRPAQAVQGIVRIWGAPADAGLIAAWGRGFHALQPGATVTATLHGPESAMMGVYTGVAEVALMGREMRQPAEFMAFTWAWRYPPTSIEVANASARSSRGFASLAVLVAADNPLARLTLAQLDGVFGAEHRRGSTELRTWGDLGLTGAWRDRPIHVLGPPIDSVPALFFRQTVLSGSYKWNGGLVEMADERARMEAVARDDAAITYGSLASAPPGLKAVPLAATADSEAVALTAASVAARTYPLTRVVTLVLNRAPGAPIDPKTKEFLRYVLSAEGQAEVARDGRYVPLSAASVRAELKKIE